MDLRIDQSDQSDGVRGQVQAEGVGQDGAESKGWPDGSVRGVLGKVRAVGAGHYGQITPGTVHAEGAGHVRDQELGGHGGHEHRVLSKVRADRASQDSLRVPSTVRAVGAGQGGATGHGVRNRVRAEEVRQSGSNKGQLRESGDQSDQSDLVHGMKGKGTDKFTMKNTNMTKTVRERISGFERQPDPVAGKAAGNFRFVKDHIGINPFLREESPLKRCKQSRSEAARSSPARPPSSPRWPRPRRRILSQGNIAGLQTHPTIQQPSLLPRERDRATSALPPEGEQHTLLFWSRSSGASSSTPSSTSTKRKLERDNNIIKCKAITEGSPKVKKIVKNIESIENKEEKKISSKIKIKIKEKKKEEEESLLLMKKDAYLQGWMLEARRGLQTPAPSCLISESEVTAARLSSAWGSAKEAEGLGVKELQE